MELPKVELPTADEFRTEVVDFFGELQEAVAAAPAKVQTLLIDLRDHVEGRAGELRTRAEGAVADVRERIGR
ncbi:MAG: hypothetical protein E6Q90_02750 [Actinobacteria bacterium]|nr:MAG: hypothetical protein E6Q90_02750 [Actinomycetota bacterium]